MLQIRKINVYTSDVDGGYILLGRCDTLGPVSLATLMTHLGFIRDYETTFYNPLTKEYVEYDDIYIEVYQDPTLEHTGSHRWGVA